MKIIQTLLNNWPIKGVEYYILAVTRFWNRLGVCACVCCLDGWQLKQWQNMEAVLRWWSYKHAYRRLTWLADAVVPPVMCKTFWFQCFMHAELKHFVFHFRRQRASQELFQPCWRTPWDRNELRVCKYTPDGSLGVSARPIICTWIYSHGRYEVAA